MNRPLLPYGVRVIGLEIMNLLHPRLTDPFLRLPGEYLNCCGIDEPNDPGGVQSTMPSPAELTICSSSPATLRVSLSAFKRSPVSRLSRIRVVVKVISPKAVLTSKAQRIPDGG